MNAKQQILNQVDKSSTPVSMFAMGMCSDVQELIRMGDLKGAMEVLNNIKIVIDERMSVKDEHGRHMEKGD